MRIRSFMIGRKPRRTKEKRKRNQKIIDKAIEILEKQGKITTFFPAIYETLFRENSLELSNIAFIENLFPVKVDDRNSYFICPWCATKDHYAVVAHSDLISRPIHCYHSDHMGWIVTGHSWLIKFILNREETSYLKLVKRFKYLYDKPKISPQEAFRLRTSLGCPEDIIEDVCLDVKAYIALLEEQKIKDRGVKVRTPYG